MHCPPFAEPQRNICLGGPYALVFTSGDGAHQENSWEEMGGSKLLQNSPSWLLCIPGIKAISAVCCMEKITYKHKGSVTLVQSFSFYTEYIAHYNILLYQLKMFSGKLIIWCINTKNT